MPASGPSDLPDSVLESALARLVGREAHELPAITAGLTAEYPEHAAALRVLASDLQRAERRLLHTFGPTAAEDPERIGVYRVQRRLGEGAFGVVYLCTQQEPIRREVAVKVLRPGAGDRSTLARFENERQLLVGFDHPGIASMIDAGALADGRPYFTMEYVDGVPIHEYCDRNRLALEDRLRLFLDLCDAVQHAHAHGVVHRDLKPANVLVGTRDGVAVPKVIDFGIARSLLAIQGQALATATGRVVGTPGYMSPEQAAGIAADARADVFSLGVMLYELLVGDLPWQRSESSATTEPLRPSRRVQGDSRRSTAIAGLRATAPRTLVSRLRGDLDWIVLQALDADRERRYQSVRDFAEDIGRHLRHEPVAACPPSAGYRLRKFAQRHRAAIAWASAVAAVAGLGLFAAWHQSSAATAAVDARIGDLVSAVQRLQERVSDAMLEDAPDDLVKRMVEDSLALHDRALRDGCDRSDLRYQRVRALSDLVGIHFQLGQYPQAQEIAEAAQREAQQLVDNDASDQNRLELAAAGRDIGRCSFMQGNYAAARAASASAVAAFEEMHARNPALCAVLLARAQVELASALGRSGEPEAQVAAQRRALEVLKAHAAQSRDAVVQRDLVRFHCGLANMLLRRDDVEGAEGTLQTAMHLAATLPLVSDEERAQAALRMSQLCAKKEQPLRAIEHATTSATLVDGILARHPNRHFVRWSFLELHTILAVQYLRSDQPEAALAQATLIQGRMQEFAATHAIELARSSVRMARAVIETDHWLQCDAAEGWLQRGLEALAAEQPDQANAERTRATMRAEMLTLRGYCLDVAGRPFAAARWNEVIDAIGQAELHGYLGLANLLASRSRLAGGDIAGARAALDDVGTPPVGHAAAHQCGREAVAIAAAEFAAPARSESPPGGENWPARHLAAQALAMAARRAAGGEQDAIALRRRAIVFCEQLLREPAGAGNAEVHDLLCAQTGVRLASLVDLGRAQQLRAASVPVLDGMRTRMPWWWNEPLWIECRLDRARDLLATDLPAAVRELEVLSPCLREPGDLLAASACYVDCATAGSDPRTTAGVRSAALELLRRAVAAGLRGRRDVLAGLRPLHDDPTFQELIARVPE